MDQPEQVVVKKSNKKIFIIVSIVILLLVIFIGVGAYLLFNKPKSSEVVNPPPPVSTVPTDQTFTYVIKDNKTYKKIGSGTLQLVFDHPIIHIDSIETFSYYIPSIDKTKDTNNTTQQYFQYFIPNKVNSLEGDTYQFPTSYSSDGKYEIEIVPAQYVGGIRMIIRNTATKEVIRNLPNRNGVFQWMDNSSIVFTSFGDCVLTKNSVTGLEDCPTNVNLGVSVYNIDTNTLTNVWQTADISGEALNVEQLLAVNNNIYFNFMHSKAVDNVGEVIVEDTDYQYSLTDSSLTKVTDNPYKQITADFVSLGYKSSPFAVKNYEIDGSKLLVSLSTLSNENTWYLFDPTSPNALLELGKGLDILFSKVDLVKELNITDSTTINEEDVVSGYRKITDLFYNVSFSIPKDWYTIHSTNTGVFPNDAKPEDAVIMSVKVYTYNNDLNTYFTEKGIYQSYPSKTDMTINGYQAFEAIKVDESYTDHLFVVKNGSTVVGFYFRVIASHFNFYTKQTTTNDNSKYNTEFEKMVNSVQIN